MQPIAGRRGAAALAFLLTAIALYASHSGAVDAASDEDHAGFNGVWESARERRGAGGPPENADRRRPPPRVAQGPGARPDGPPVRRAPRADEPEGLDAGDRHVRALMTAEGRAAFDAMDPHDLPANNCISPGLPHIAGVPGMQEWILDGDHLTIRHEYYSTVRRADIGAPRHVAPAEHSHDGDRVAWFDGDTLVIETANLAATLGGLARNAPASDARTVVERYTLSEDGQTLRGEMTITDPKHLTEPLVLPVRLTRAEPGAEVVFFDCDVEAAQRYLDD